MSVRKPAAAGPRRRSPQRRIAVYGKGGIGKSTVVSNLSLLFLRQGAKVLQIGCDPKADSSHLHIPIEDIRPVMPGLIRGQGPDTDLRKLGLSHVMKGRTGVHCLETGGPDPGRGCAGFGMSSAMMLFDRIPGFYDRYDAILYDILGDVVCGGFALPLRAGRAREVYILVSGDVASAYAANNIARAVMNNGTHGARLAGLISNRSGPEAPITPSGLEQLAQRLGTRLVADIPADPQVMAAAARGATVTELFPASAAAKTYRKAFEAVASVREEDLVIPKPMENLELVRFLRRLGAYGAP